MKELRARSHLPHRRSPALSIKPTKRSNASNGRCVVAAVALPCPCGQVTDSFGFNFRDAGLCRAVQLIWRLFLVCDLQHDATVDLAGTHFIEDVIDVFHPHHCVIAFHEPTRRQR